MLSCNRKFGVLWAGMLVDRERKRSGFGGIRVGFILVTSCNTKVSENFKNSGLNKKQAVVSTRL